MDKDNLHTLFDDLQNDFDIEVPEHGHQQRFLDKLNQQDRSVVVLKAKRSIWKPFIGIAASIALLVSVFISYQSNNASRDLASVSPEMATTQDFFTNAINTELDKLNNETSPEYQQLKVDALFQLELLQQNYLQLKNDLDESGDDKRVIHAMISNFQSRIDLLQNVLEQIDDLKQLENNEENKQDENNYTL
jgi:hypothetical protein